MVFTYKIVAQSTLRTWKGKYNITKKIKFDTDFDENKCLKQIKSPDLFNMWVCNVYEHLEQMPSFSPSLFTTNITTQGMRF